MLLLLEYTMIGGWLKVCRVIIVEFIYLFPGSVAQSVMSD